MKDTSAERSEEARPAEELFKNKVDVEVTTILNKTDLLCIIIVLPTLAKTDRLHSVHGGGTEI